jgi:hypothetical protein
LKSALISTGYHIIDVSENSIPVFVRRTSRNKETDLAIGIFAIINYRFVGGELPYRWIEICGYGYPMDVIKVAGIVQAIYEKEPRVRFMSNDPEPTQIIYKGSSRKVPCDFSE